jgi:hypothetical protein
VTIPNMGYYNIFYALLLIAVGWKTSRSGAHIIASKLAGASCLKSPKLNA